MRLVTGDEMEKQNLKNEREDYISSTTERLTGLKMAGEAAELEWELKNKEAHIELLLESERGLVRELERVKASRMYRLGEILKKMPRAVREAVIPFGSKRRFCVSLAVHFLRHPVLTIKKGSPSEQYRQYCKSAAEMLKTMEQSRSGEVYIPKLEVFKETGTKKGQIPPALAKDKSEYKVLEVPCFQDIQVSIVIPVYNQFHFTYYCIESILANSGDVTYEILIANDCSTDLTADIEEIIRGVKLITNQTNLRFLKNCNHAAQFARGKYLLFLNNDTLVKENWLRPLVTLIESDERIGMVGSKLVYPDGTLQEAGGIIWKDGSAWNFGNGDDASASEYNYVKETDYISGAAIMLYRTLWNEIGGFDEYFTPAYCEDSDLAFAVRARGYRVLYQPLSEVVHFEGISNGTEVSEGQKAYQVINQRKFVHKWRKELRRHQANGVDAFHARERSADRPLLLMIDHYVPQYDRDAGSRTVYQYLRLFVSLGFNVKFIGDNFYQHEPYTTVLQQMGIEVLYGPFYANNWKKWIEGNAPHIEYVFLNRPHISVKYIDFIREKTKARIIYYGHDLHFLREMREYDLTKNEDLLKTAEEWKEKELSLMRKADISYYPSSVEENAIHEIDDSIPVKAIPAYLFDHVKDCMYDYAERKDLMFIGGFGHTPNVDAVKWLASEIMPVLINDIPDIVVHVLGSNPPEEIKKLGNRNLVIEGFVTDEELEAFYHKCRLSVVPLRYGAGIKGKIIEAMKYGTPVATTSIGAEGITGAEALMLIEDDAEGFAKAVSALYRDERKLSQMSRDSVEYIRNHFSPQNAVRVIAGDFGIEEEIL